MCIGHIINYRLRGALINSASGHLFQVKCEQYWTPGTKHFGNITVTTTSEIPLEDWTIRDFDIKNVRATSEFQNVCHCDSLICSFENSVSFRLKPPRLVQCDISISQPGQIMAYQKPQSSLLASDIWSESTWTNTDTVLL